MRLTLVAPPADLPVTLAQAKAQCRVDHGDENELIEQKLKSAVAWFDGYRGILGRCLVTQTWRADITRLGGIVALPFPDITTISAAFTDTEAGPVDFERLDCGSMSSVRALTGGGRPASITFTAGFGSPYQVPEPIRSAILMMTDHLYNHRGATGSDGGGLPIEIDQMISPYRMLRV